MANNRYFMKCPVCADEHFFGKSLGEGIYNMRSWQGQMFSPKELLSEMHNPARDLKDAMGNAAVLNDLYDWMWKHMMDCHKDEFRGGELFKVISEYPSDLTEKEGALK